MVLLHFLIFFWCFSFHLQTFPDLSNLSTCSITGRVLWEDCSSRPQDKSSLTGAIASKKRRWQTPVVLIDSDTEEVPAKPKLAVKLGSAMKIAIRDLPPREGTTTKTKIATLHRGEELAKENGIDHNLRFQKLHRKNSDVLEGGHWSKFLRALGAGNCQNLVCGSCRELWQIVWGCPEEKTAGLSQSKGTEDEMTPAIVGEPPPEVPLVPHSPPQRKRGRPVAMEKMFSTAEWLQIYRPDTYERILAEDSKLRYFCKVCSIAVNFWRPHSLKYVRSHEMAQAHRDPTAVQPFNPTHGASEVCNGQSLETEAHELFAIHESIRTWLAAGQPKLKPVGDEAPSLLDMVIFSIAANGVIQVRSAACKQIRHGHGMCSACEVDTRKKQLVRLLCGWAYKIDLARWAFLRFYQPKEGEKFGQQLAQRDYHCLGLAGHDIQEMHKADLKSLCCRARESLESIPKLRRSAQLQDMMDRVLVPCHLYFGNSTAAAAHSSFVSQFAFQVANGTIHEKDLKLACAVAQGQFRSDALVHTLFQSFMAMLDKKERGLTRLRTSSALQEESVVDLLSILGKNKEVQSLFAKFGVSWRCPPKLPLLHCSLPDFFCAIPISFEEMRNFALLSWVRKVQ